MDSSKVKPTDKYNLSRRMEPFRNMMLDNASRWSLEEEQTPAEHDQLSREDDTADTAAALSADPFVPPINATYTFHQRGATPGMSFPANMGHSASLSGPLSASVSADTFPIVPYGDPLYYVPRHADPQYNAAFPQPSQPPPAYYLPSEAPATSPLSPPAFNPPPPSSAIPSPATSRRSLAIAPANSGWSPAHNPRRLPHSVDSVRIVDRIPGVYYIVDTSALSPDAVTYGAFGPGFFIPDHRAMQTRTPQGSSTGDGWPQFPSAAQSQWRQSPHAPPTLRPSPMGATPTWPSFEGSGDMGDIPGTFGAQAMSSAFPQQYPVASGTGQTYPHPPFPGSHHAQSPDPPTIRRPRRKRDPSETTGGDGRAGPSRKTVKKRGAASGMAGSSRSRDDRSKTGEGSGLPGAGMFSLHEAPSP
ncbi:hypothetical protein C8T65DRAFT_648947 [Cerioporus squamosus]|nr:hypothetical protein C8T65DRAFT_648947 [Cerioporus squamosus]